MTAKTAIVASNHPHHNGTMLTVTFDNSGAAPGASKSQILRRGQRSLHAAVDKRVRALQGFRPASTQPPIPIPQPSQLGKDGDVFEFAIDNIIDGAGNQTERVTVPVKIDYASDKTGPSWYSLTFGASVNWFINWDGCRSSSTQLTPGRYNSIGVINNTGRTPFLSHGTYHSRGDLSQAVAWQPTQHPCISFRLANNNPRSDRRSASS